MLVQTSNFFQPCFPSDSQTHCCDFGAGQTCISNGLCLVNWDSSLNTGACTDSSWGTSACFQDCPQFSTPYRCNNNNWCCSNGGNIISCCNDRNVALNQIPDLALVQNGSAFIANWTMAPNALLAILTQSGSTKTTGSPVSSSSAITGNSSGGSTSSQAPVSSPEQIRRH